MMNKKNILILIIASIAVLLITTVFLQSKKHEYLKTQSNERIATITPSYQSSCEKSKTNKNEGMYFCNTYSIKLPEEWNTIDSIEFTNYDVRKAAGRDYDPVLDQGKQKFSIVLIPTTHDVKTTVAEQVETLKENVISTTQLTINNYSVTKVYAKHPAGNNIETYYIQMIQKHVSLR